MNRMHSPFIRKLPALGLLGLLFGCSDLAPGESPVPVPSERTRVDAATPRPEVEVILKGPKGAESGTVSFDLEHPNTPDGQEAGTVRVDPHNASFGRAEAPVLWTVFIGWNCPFSGQLVASIKALRAKHPDSLRIVFKHVLTPHDPVGLDWARRAVLMSRDDFWRFGLEALQTAPSSRGSWTDYRMANALSEEEIREADIRLEMDGMIAQELKIRSTPQSILNGKRMTGAKDVHVFEELLSGHPGAPRGEVTP